MQWYHRPTLLLSISCICVCHVLSMHLTGFLSCKSKCVTYLIAEPSVSRILQEFRRKSYPDYFFRNSARRNQMALELFKNDIQTCQRAIVQFKCCCSNINSNVV